MKRLRSASKLALALLMSLCALVFLALIVTRVEQHFFRQRAVLLLSQVQSIELRKTSWQEAQTQFQRWDADRKLDEHCDPHKCSVQITLNDPVLGYLSERNLFVKLDDYFRWRLKLSYDTGPFVRSEFWLLRVYMRAGGHPARVIANIGMRDDIVWSKGISVAIETYAHADQWSGAQPFEFTLFAEVNSRPRFDYFGDRWLSSQLMLHPNYAIGRPDGCEVCVMGWVKFTPYAAPEDVSRLMQLNLSCLTQWHPCATQSDIMPAAWAQYVSEHSRTYQPEQPPACSPTIVEILGRDSANIATGEVVRYHENFYSNGYDKIVATVRVLERLKGMAAWNVGETRDVTLRTGTICADDKVHVGSRLIFYGGFDRSNDVHYHRKMPWPVIPMNDSNLSFFQHGIDQDYSAIDKIE
jgi:hypothetical protein